MAMELLTSPTPNGWKVTIMVEELREAGFELADVTVTPIDLMNGDQFTEAFTAVNPNQKIPALVDGDRNVIEHCATHLPDFKRVRSVHVVDTLPRSTLEKIAKKELRDRLQPITEGA